MIPLKLRLLLVDDALETNLEIYQNFYLNFYLLFLLNNHALYDLASLAQTLPLFQLEVS